MDSHDCHPEPLWTPITQSLGRPELSADLDADVCVIGAGIAGLSVAYQLCLAGRSVIVLDKGITGGGETVRTTAHLSNAIDDRYFLMEELHGQKAARVCAESHTQAIETVQEIVRNESIDCAFKRLDGFLFLPPGESETILDRELAAARRAGLDGVERLARTPGVEYELGPCLRFPRQGQFHPIRYLFGLSNAIEKRGGRIFNNTEVTEVVDDKPLRVRTVAGFRVRAHDVVLATNTPALNRFVIHTKQAAYRTYAIAGRIPREAVTDALYWDTSETPGDLSAPYHYVRFQGENTSDDLERLENEGGMASETGPEDLLIVGGEDHKTGQSDPPHDRWERLERWARVRFPMLKEVQYRWSGQIMEPVDGIAFIGKNPLGPEGAYIVTGDSGMGMTHGTIAGILIRELIMHGGHPWQEVYDPSRKTLRSWGEFVKENLNSLEQLSAWISPGEVGSVSAIAPGQGAVVRSGLRLIAAYRDPAGHLNECSAICPHLGCVVAWNSVEKSWDCPCHGSRFDPLGRVLNGPATQGLTHIEIEAEAMAHH